jgi:hypothetical protein
MISGQEVLPIQSHSDDCLSENADQISKYEYTVGARYRYCGRHLEPVREEAPSFRNRLSYSYMLRSFHVPRLTFFVDLTPRMTSRINGCHV